MIEWVVWWCKQAHYAIWCTLCCSIHCSCSDGLELVWPLTWQSCQNRKETSTRLGKERERARGTVEKGDEHCACELWTMTDVWRVPQRSITVVSSTQILGALSLGIRYSYTARSHQWIGLGIAASRPNQTSPLRVADEPMLLNITFLNWCCCWQWIINEKDLLRDLMDFRKSFNGIGLASLKRWFI